MGLREVAEADLGNILEDLTGFGFAITVIDPAGLSINFVGLSNDISQLIDPDTGQAVSGRFASVALRISTLQASAFTELPKGVSDKTIKPWRVDFLDINGNVGTFKVVQSNPDRGLGILTCIVEAYTP